MQPFARLGALLASKDGALDALGILLGAADGADVACAVGALLGVLLASKDGALVA